MKKFVFLLLGLFFISAISFGQIHSKKSKFSIGLVGSHHAITKIDEISELITEPSISYRVGDPSVNLFGAGLKLQYKLKNWLAIGAEYSFSQRKIESTLSHDYSQHVKVFDYGAFAKFYPFSIKDAVGEQKFMFYVPIRLLFSAQSANIEYDYTIPDSEGNTVGTIGKTNSGISYTIVGLGGEFYVSKKLIINAEVTDDYEFADTRRFSIGLFLRL